MKEAKDSLAAGQPAPAPGPRPQTCPVCDGNAVSVLLVAHDCKDRGKRLNPRPQRNKPTELVCSCGANRMVNVLVCHGCQAVLVDRRLAGPGAAIAQPPAGPGA
jgi:hypothetical protein